jgi:hypothetical protein
MPRLDFRLFTSALGLQKKRSKPKVIDALLCLRAVTIYQKSGRFYLISYVGH